MTSPELDEIAIVFDDGTAFPFVTSLTLTDTFLDPCQTMEATVAADETRFALLASARAGMAYTVTVNGAPQITGLLDATSVHTSRAGTEVRIRGRDLMARIVDGNVDPSLQVAKEMPFGTFASKLFESFGVVNVALLEDFEAGRNVAVGRAVRPGKSKRRKKISDPAKDLRPRNNEGGWQYFSRIAHRLGLHAWAMPDGKGIVVGGPDYDQEPSFDILHTRDGGETNNIIEASAESDQTHVPSHVWVRGKGSPAGKRSTYIGFAENPAATTFKPFYVCDEESSEKAHCDATARLVLSRGLLKAQCYEVTLRGASDPKSGRIYNVDTVCNVNDELCGVFGPMWVQKRALSMSRDAGKVTRLSLMPPNALLFDYYVSDEVPIAPATYAPAVAKVKSPNPGIPLALQGSPELVFKWVKGEL